jgi:hypothetical protein
MISIRIQQVLKKSIYSELFRPSPLTSISTMNKRLYIILAVGMITASCTEKIDLKLDTTYTRLVVDGFIRSDPGTYTVNLTKTADYFSNVAAPREAGASLVISDGINTFPLTETVPGQSGIYKTDPDFAGIPGRDYTLHISLAEVIASATEYTASCKMDSVTRLDSIKAELNPNFGEDGHWEVKVYAQDPPGRKNYYLINLYRNNKLWSDTINKVNVTDNQLYAGKYINGAIVFFINNSNKFETLYPGDTIMVELSAITKEYFEFVNQVKQAGFSIPFFTGPPANVVGNIDNHGVGFFAAYSSSFAKTVVR